MRWFDAVNLMVAPERAVHSFTIAISTRRDSFFEARGSSGPHEAYSMRDLSMPFPTRNCPTV